MSDASFYTTTAYTSNLLSLLVNLEDGLSKSRLYSVLVTGGSVTLSCNYDLILVDSTASVTVSMPPSPTTGDRYKILKYDATAGTLTISRNGENVNSSAANKTTITRWDGWEFIYSGDSAIGWLAMDISAT